MTLRSLCAVDQCGRPHYAHGYCKSHERRVARLGTPLGETPIGSEPRARRPVAERVWAHVDRSGGPGACWLWTGYVHRGYGRVTLRPGRPGAAHRAVFEAVRGPIPRGLTLDHLCRNKSCVNPAHLEPVTAVENARRAHMDLAAERKICKAGLHAITEPYVFGRLRKCKACQATRHTIYMRGYRARQRRTA